MSQVRVAVAQYDIGYFDHWDQFAAKLAGWVTEAADQQSQLLVFPEYGSMELASLFGADVYTDLHRQLLSMQSLYERWQTLHLQLAKQHNLLILGASYPVQQRDGNFRNRATLFGPEGVLGYQDKLVMTRFETEQWQIGAGEKIALIDTPLGKIGINICYDSEFPLIARQQAEAGANLILVPSCTDTEAGFHRVRIGCQARALENQCFVVQSPTWGQADWSEAVDVNTGRASVYTPVDYGFPDNGVLVEGTADSPGWVYADLDLAAISHVRQTGQVFNYRDWPRQTGLTIRD